MITIRNNTQHYDIILLMIITLILLNLAQCITIKIVTKITLLEALS